MEEEREEPRPVKDPDECLQLLHHAAISKTEQSQTTIRRDFAGRVLQLLRSTGSPSTNLHCCSALSSSHLASRTPTMPELPRRQDMKHSTVMISRSERALKIWSVWCNDGGFTMIDGAPPPAASHAGVGRLHQRLVEISEIRTTKTNVDFNFGLLSVLVSLTPAFSLLADYFVFPGEQVLPRRTGDRSSDPLRSSLTDGQEAEVLGEIVELHSERASRKGGTNSVNDQIRTNPRSNRAGIPKSDAAPTVAMEFPTGELRDRTQKLPAGTRSPSDLQESRSTSGLWGTFKDEQPAPGFSPPPLLLPRRLSPPAR